MGKKLKTLLAIAGSDPMGGAGIQCDIRAGGVLGLHVLTAVTAVTSQNSKSISSLGILESDILESQLNAIKEDVIPDAVKIGMIGSISNLKVIVNFLQSLPENIPVVVDPIIKTTVDVYKVFDSETILEYYKKYLFPLATAITPNLNELRLLDVNISEDCLSGNLPTLLNTNAVIIKGGHGFDQDIKDILIEKNKKPVIFSHSRIKHCNLHGTGCAYSSILAALLGLDLTLEDAFKLTSSKIFEIISRSGDYKLGESKYGSLNINNYFL